MTPVLAWVAAISWLATVLTAADGTGDPITFFLSQGVLGVVVFMLWKEYRAEKASKEAMTNKVINELVPLISRGTEAMERMAKADEQRKGR